VGIGVSSKCPKRFLTPWPFLPSSGLMRITGGVAARISLKTPPGATTRPATDFLREAVFSSLARATEQARVLDLFAGTGAYGLEALSRGAMYCHFVETDRRACTCLQHNAQAVKKSLQAAGLSAPQWSLSTHDALRHRPEPESVDLIFCDPPYALLPKVLPQLETWMRGLRPGGWLLLEAPGSTLPGTHPVPQRCLGRGKQQPHAHLFQGHSPKSL
jgi:16S rRNA (guanine966-N2)-methyltransferase